MNEKANNWQFLLSQADEQLADLPDVLKTLKETWATFAPSLPPFPISASAVLGAPSPVPTGAVRATSHFFFFFS